MSMHLSFKEMRGWSIRIGALVALLAHSTVYGTQHGPLLEPQPASIASQSRGSRSKFLDSSFGHFGSKRKCEKVPCASHTGMLIKK